MNPPPPPPPPPPAPRKSRLWPIIAVVLLLTIVIGGTGLFFAARFIGKTVEAQKDRRARFAELEAQRREMTAAARKSAEEGTVEGMTDRVSAFGNSLGNAASSATGVERQALTLLQRLMESMTPAIRAYEASFKELQDAGSTQPQTLKTREVIAERVVLVKKFGEANERLAETLEGLESKAQQEMEKLGVSPKDRQDFLSVFSRSMNLELNRTIRQCDRELVTILLSMLAILDREWGAWRADGDNVIFERQSAIDEYNQFAEQIQDIADRQSTAQQELLKRTSTQRALR